MGVVGDVRGNDATPSNFSSRLEGEPVAVAYTSLVPILRADDEGNRTSPSWRVSAPEFAVRTSGNPSAFIDPVRQRIP